MSIKYGSKNNILIKDIPNPTQNIPLTNEPAVWVRPSDWLTLPTVSSTDQKFVGLFAVMNDNSNYVALLATVSTGTYTVDWGDGTSPQTYTSNTQANYVYNYATISNSTISTLGYKQVIITVTPTTGNLLTVDLQQQYVNTTLFPGTMPNPNPGKWLDIIMGSPSMTGINIGNTQPGPVIKVAMRMLEQVSIMSVASSFTSFSFLLSNLFALRSVPNLASQNVTDFSNLFNNDNKLTHAPLLNSSNVTNFNTVFQGCNSLANISNLTLMNTSKVNSMSDAFNGCYSLKSIPNFNTSNVTNFVRTFANCTSLINMANLDTGKVTNTTLMFQNSTCLESIPNFNTSNVTTIDQMFSGCNNLKTTPILNLSNVTSATNMFNGCRNLTYVPKLSLPKVTDVTAMFLSCTRLEIVDGFYNTSNLINMTQMFSGCSSLKSTPFISDTSKVTNMSQTFNGCVNIVDYSNIANANTSNLLNTSQMFLNNYSMYVAPNIGLSKVTNTQQMFSGCRSLSNVPLYSMSNVTITQSMFNGCGSLPTIPTLDISSVSNADTMFNGCASLNSVPLLNTSNVTSATSMFNGCSTLSNIGNLNLSKVVSLGTMFAGTSISDFPAFNLTNASTITTAFSSNFAAQALITNAKVSLSITNSSYSKSAMETLFTNLGSNNTTQTVTISSNPGADTAVSKTGLNITAGSNVIPITNTVGITTGMYAIGAGVNYSAVNFTDAGDLVTLNNHGMAANTMITFQTILSTTGISNWIPYYVTNPTTNTFQLSATPGGAVLPLTTDGTGTLNRPMQVTTVNANSNVVMNYNCGTTASAVTVNFRILNSFLATMKNWTVSG